MKISKAKLKTIIEEELEKILLSEAKSSKYPNLTQTSIETHTPRSMVNTVEVTPKGREELLNKREKFPAPKSPEMKRSIPAVKKLFPKLSSKDIKREIELSAGSTNHVGDILDYLVGWMFPAVSDRDRVDIAALEVAESWSDIRNLDIDEAAAEDFLKKRTEGIVARAKVMFDKEQSLPPRPARNVIVPAAAIPGTPAYRQLQGLTNPTKK